MKQINIKELVYEKMRNSLGNGGRVNLLRKRKTI